MNTFYCMTARHYLMWRIRPISNSSIQDSEKAVSARILPFLMPMMNISALVFTSHTLGTQKGIGRNLMGCYHLICAIVL